MDALIENNDTKITMSELGIFLIDFEDSSPALALNRRSIKNRNGFINYGAVHTQKNITLVGTFLSKDPYELEVNKDKINGLISNDEPFYITKMIPTRELYGYENPGESTEIELLNIPHAKYKYRYKVIAENSIQYDFLGRYEKGLLTRITIGLITAEMPYGETIPVDEPVNNYIYYEGNAKCSQLEHQWSIRLIANEQQDGDFTVTVGDTVFTHKSVKKVQKGDIFILNGIETLHNGENVTSRTNYAYFVLTGRNGGLNEFKTTFKGNFEILNKVNFYI